MRGCQRTQEWVTDVTMGMRAAAVTKNALSQITQEAPSVLRPFHLGNLSNLR